MSLELAFCVASLVTATVPFLSAMAYPGPLFTLSFYCILSKAILWTMTSPSSKPRGFNSSSRSGESDDDSYEKSYIAYSKEHKGDDRYNRLNFGSINTFNNLRSTNTYD